MRRAVLAVLALIGGACGSGGGVAGDAARIDDGGGPVPRDGQVVAPEGGGPRDGSSRDGSSRDGSSVVDSGVEGSVADSDLASDGLAADLPPVASVLPPPPPGAVRIRFSVDDSADKAYAAGELQLKGSFAFDAATNVVALDAGWTGPTVPLLDDGPTGHEGPGSKAGDHRFSAVVYLVPPAVGVTLEYGLQSPAGWAWPDGPNAKITIASGTPVGSLVDLPPYKLPPRVGVDAIWTVDAGKLAGRTVAAGYEMVVVRATATHWAPLPCNDDGVAGDPTPGDGRYTCALGQHLGKGRRFPHLGLVPPGATVRFYVDIGGQGYRETAGIALQLVSATGAAAVALSKLGADLGFTVPPSASPLAAPAADASPLPAGLRGDLPGGTFDLPAAALGINGHYVVPGSYDAHSAAPLLLALHGASEQGQWMVDVWKTLAEDFGLIVLAPSSASTSWDLKAVFAGQTPVEDPPLLAAVSWLRGRYRIDAGRIGVEGFSDGASMALYMGLTHGDLFNVALANSAGGMGNNYPLPDKPAIYLTHGDADAVLPVQNARWIRDTLVAAGYELKYVELPGVGHVFPTAHKLPMLRWLDSHSR